MPDVARTLCAALKSFAARRNESDAALVGAAAAKAPQSGAAILAEYAAGGITEAVLSSKLLEAVEKADLEAALEQATSMTGGLAGAVEPGSDSGAPTLFLAQTPRGLLSEPIVAARTVYHPVFALTMLPGVFLPPGSSIARQLEAGTADASDSDNNG